ncbi:impB/mucB/samB-like protein 2 [Elsinoe fawcettii]|nr:impB/mucB/samB-like protein 2 [Elsinoe fawcettii]
MSQYTYRDLNDLAQASPSCSLRTIALIDFDAFYAQCESVRLGLDDTKPLAVLQWTTLIAVNYPAKAAGVKRGDSADIARQKCPGIVIQHVPTWRAGDTEWAYRAEVSKNMEIDKTSLDPYREASRNSMDLIKDFLGKKVQIERAGIDEAFIDLSSLVHDKLLAHFPELAECNEPGSQLPPAAIELDWSDEELLYRQDVTQVEFDWDDIALYIANDLMRELRQRMFKRMRYTTSAGIAKNKVVAKLLASHRKPNGQSVLLNRHVPRFLDTKAATTFWGLKGDLGRRLTQAFGTSKVRQLLKVPLPEMQSQVGTEEGLWIYQLLRGHDPAEVSQRTRLQSMIATKMFIPNLETTTQAIGWLQVFAADLANRLADDIAFSGEMRPRTLTLGHSTDYRSKKPARTRQAPMHFAGVLTSDIILAQATELLNQASSDADFWPCQSLLVRLSNFETLNSVKGETISADSETFPGGSSPSRRGAQMSLDRFISKGTSAMPDLATARLNSSISEPSEPPKLALSVKGSDSYTCPHCSEEVPEMEVLTHLDWHVAMDMNGKSLD